MSDFIDQMDERNEHLEAANLANIRAKAVIAPGVPGECDYCGEYAPRLINSACALCRDKRKLP